MNWKVTAPSRGFKFCNWSVFMENHISRQLLLKFVSTVCESGNRCSPVPSDTDQHRDSHPLAGTKKPTQSVFTVKCPLRHFGILPSSQHLMVTSTGII